ncbi:glycosyltransferase family 4 protein [Desulfosudis oleivorans]|uniref:Glycosyl transferase group 1 n=1 Tax=Desulfosudis oleivorans (strain DSM 6200 / JCM 39069 / Hxd3) TaxID=96561 RepID=A8ZTS3_DESOH|nr:glycosyltransferase family 4 protein [Desulfosudis oleivorans]ABW67856.1 glycosyl transferase group 1 [Desulfosudis oleivorans Hxd3]
MVSSLKILHLISQRPDATGSGVYVQAMLRHAAQKGHCNHLVAGIQANNIPQAPVVNQCECAFVCFEGPDTPLPIVGMSDVMPYKSRRFCDLSDNAVDEYETCFAEKLRHAVKRFAPDLIHSHHLWLVTSLARRMFPGLPMVTTCHGTDLRQFQNCPHLQARVLEGCAGLDAVMALSRAQKTEIASLYGLSEEKIHVVGAGYDEALFYLQAKPVPHPVQVVYAGKLCNAKGTPWLLKALSAIHTVPWQLHLVGGGAGEEADQCWKMAGDLGDRVCVYGAVDQSTLAALMRQSHIFVLPSFFEGLPLVLLEALACGCRVVATDLPGVAEVLDGMDADYISRVHPPGLHTVDKPFTQDLDRFVKDLANVLTTQMAAAVQQPDIDLSLIQDRLSGFTWGRVFERVERVYRSVCRLS